MLNLYIFLPGVLFFSLKDEILCVGNPWFSGPNTTFQSPKSTFSSRLKAFNARSLQRFSTCVLCNRFCVGYTKATMIHFTSLHWHKRESFLAAAFFFTSRPVGEASTVLQVALLAMQAFSRREPSSWSGQGLPWRGPMPSALLSLLAEVLRPREEGRSTLLSLLAEVLRPMEPRHSALLSLLAEVLRPREEGRSTLLSLLAEVLLCHDVVAAHAQCKD